MTKHTLSRRAALTTLASAGVATAMPAVALALPSSVTADTALLALQPRIVAANARVDAACDRLRDADLLRIACKPSPDEEGASAEQDAANEAWGEVRDEIAMTPATTLAGLRFKATCIEGAWDDTFLMQSIVEDILTITGGEA